jgi:glycosyltransferase involved in cell wall biosynthesis
VIFIANVLTMNGGTTFLIRACRELHGRGIKVAVLVLFPITDIELCNELQRYAKVVHLRDYLWGSGLFFPGQLMTFAPVRWPILFIALRPYGNTVHVMGVFGLLFAFRAIHKQSILKVTAGVYHQNEYLLPSVKNFFSQTFYQCFNSLDAKQILFFNQISALNYGKFFKRDFANSLVAPIGVDIPVDRKFANYEREGARLVSVGNLVNFKTYNRHIIGVVAELAEKYPDMRYEIFGTGPEESALKVLVQNLRVQDRVHFYGPVPYSKFAETVCSATLFIGSGTALIEAAALGVPSMVGIESIQQPETYGFLSDVVGLSYNELMPDLVRVPMRDLIDKLMGDSVLAMKISEACKTKANEFSVTSTADILVILFSNTKGHCRGISAAHTILLFGSFLLVAIRDRLGFSSMFRNRRDQSLFG